MRGNIIDDYTWNIFMNAKFKIQTFVLVKMNL